MLHILLFILKIIGIVLLCILGLLFFGTVCVLFVPVRYRVEAVRKEGEGEPPVAVTVKVTWLLHFVNVLVRFSGSLSARARIMFVTVFRLPRKAKRGGRAQADGPGSGKDRKRRKKEEAKEPEKPGNGGTGRENGPAKDENSGGTAGNRKNAGETPPDGAAATAGGTGGGKKDTAQAADGESAPEPAKGPALWDRLRAVPEILRGILSKIKSIFENIQYTIQNICDRIRAVSDNVAYYRGVIEGETFQRSYALCKKELLSIAKSLKPDRFEAALVVGMDDPASTGEILAVCGMLYPILGPQVNVAGDFEKKRLEGRVFIRGKLRFFTFIRVAVRIYFNKDIRKLYGLLKKEAV